MSASTGNTRLAMSLMVLITLLNLGLAINFIAASDSGLARIFNSQNIYVLAAMQMVLVLMAYVACKYRPVPVPS
jgi:hypothetical protein